MSSDAPGTAAEPPSAGSPWNTGPFPVVDPFPPVVAAPDGPTSRMVTARATAAVTLVIAATTRLRR
jgi:hypothetical protein